MSTLAALSLAPPAANAAVEAVFQPVVTPEGATVDLVASLAPQAQPFDMVGPYCERGAVFDVCIDSGKFERDSRYRQFVKYWMTVVDKRHPEEPIAARTSVWTVSAAPKGGFQDGVFETQLSLRELDDGVAGGALVERIDGLEMPLFSRDGEPFLVPDRAQGELEIWLGSSNPKPITVRSRLERLDAVVSCDPPPEVEAPPYLVVEVSQVGCPGAGMVVPPSGAPVRILELKVTPKFTGALKRVILPRRKNDAPPLIKVVQSYGSLAGPSRALELAYEFRVLPSLPAMLIALLVGSLLGRSVLQSAGDLGALEPKRFVVRIVGAFLMSCAVAAVAAFLVEKDSELRIFGVTFDPYQLTSLGLIGFLVALLFERLREFIAWLGGKVPGLGGGSA